MRVGYEFAVAASADSVRSLLTDVDRSAACVPGMSLEALKPGEYSGRLRLRVGSTTVTYRGTAAVGASGDTFRLDIGGQEARGSGVAKGTMAVSLADEGNLTRVAIDADMTVTGRLGSLEPPVLSDAVRRLFARFGECVIAAVAVGEVDAEAVIGPEGGIAVARQPADVDTEPKVGGAPAEPTRGQRPQGKRARETRAEPTRGERPRGRPGRARETRATARGRPSPTLQSAPMPTPTRPTARPVAQPTGMPSALTADTTAAGDDDLLAASAQRPAWPLRTLLSWLAAATIAVVVIQLFRRRRNQDR